MRGGREGEMVEHNLREGVVSLGWGDWITETETVEQADGDALDEFFDQHYGKKYPESVRRRCRQDILRFYDEVKIGHLVVLPFKKHGPTDVLCAIGEVAGPVEFDPAGPKGSRIWRPVTWLVTEVAKTAVQRDLLSSIQYTQHTIFQPQARNSAQRILLIVTHGIDPGG